LSRPRSALTLTAVPLPTRRSILALALVAGASAFSFAPVFPASVSRRAHTSAASSLRMVVDKKDAYKITALPGDGIGETRALPRCPPTSTCAAPAVRLLLGVGCPGAR